MTAGESSFLAVLVAVLAISSTCICNMRSKNMNEQTNAQTGAQVTSKTSLMKVLFQCLKNMTMVE